MKIRILGSAAGGGLPQWNCRCPNCELARAGSPRVRPRSQSSVAVSSDGRHWFLLNASPDIRQQIFSFDALGPAPGKLRGTGIVGCVLTDAEIDHTTGLLFLREGGSFGVWSTPLVREMVNRHFSIGHVLDQFIPRPWREFAINEWFDLTLPAETDARRSEANALSSPSGIRVRAFEMPGHLPRFAREGFPDPRGSVVGLEIADARTGGLFVYAPCVGEWTLEFEQAASSAQAVMMDGTCWSDDELIRLGIGTQTSLAMGHLPVGGPNGSLERLAALPAEHKFYIHINNTNPMLDESSSEFARVVGSGIRVANDGDEIEL